MSVAPSKKYTHLFYIHNFLTQRMAPSLSAEAPARRVRDIEYAAELLGLRLDVPWSIWDGYEAGVREPGILWRYDAEERTFRGRGGGGGGVICESEMLPRQYVCQAGARSDAWREARMGREGGVEGGLVGAITRQKSSRVRHQLRARPFGAPEVDCGRLSRHGPQQLVLARPL